MQTLKVTLIQSQLYWEEVDKNLDMFSQKLSQLHAPADLIILPEMFNTGFSMDAENLAEEMGGKSMMWLTEAAEKNSCVIVASLIIKERVRYYNRLIWMQPDGSFSYYDKRHLFRMAGENQYFAPGATRLIVDLKGWQFCPLICYDLRFPVWSRNRGDYDVLIYIANWPELRSSAWKALLIARAIENQAYVLGVNRVGIDGLGKTFSGDSAAIDAQGRILSRIPSHQESVETVELDYRELQNFRKEFQAMQDADEFDIKV